MLVDKILLTVLVDAIKTGDRSGCCPQLAETAASSVTLIHLLLTYAPQCGVHTAHGKLLGVSLELL